MLPLFSLKASICSKEIILPLTTQSFQESGEENFQFN